MGASNYYPSTQSRSLLSPTCQALILLPRHLSIRTHRIIKFTTMPFHRSMLLTLLVASTVLCRSLVNLEHGVNNMLFERSVPAVVDRAHELPEVSQSPPRTCAYNRSVGTEICLTLAFAESLL
jgi:hypothetical protein